MNKLMVAALSLLVFAPACKKSCKETTATETVETKRVSGVMADVQINWDAEDQK